MNKIESFEYSSCVSMPNTSFSLLVINVHNKLECFMKLDWKGLIVQNTLAYLARISVMKKIKKFEYSSCVSMPNTSFSL